MSKNRRVVITGMGIVSSIGNNIETVKNSLINQKSGIVKSSVYQEMGFRSQIHGEVKINLEEFIDKKTVEIYGGRCCLFGSFYGTSNSRFWLIRQRNF